MKASKKTMVGVGNRFRARKRRGFGGFVLVTVGMGLSQFTFLAANIDPAKLPAPSGQTIDFAKDIKPIFERSCFRCHGPERPKSRFRLDNREAALKGGSQDVDIVPGKSAESPLIHYVAKLVEGMEMPPEDKGTPLTATEVGLLRAWIDQGVQWEAEDATKSKVKFSVTPMVGWITVSGNEKRFREHNWTREGWAGGIQEFSLQEKVGKDQTLTIEGRSILDQSDARLAIRYEKRDFGFVQAGVEEYRKYFDDAGGYNPVIAPSAATLDRDLHLNIGKAWIDFGLTMPDWPRMTLGYEYDWRQGSESTLQWGASDSGTGEVRNIHPAAKDIDEKVHILKFDLSHETPWVGIEDSLRVEFYDLKSTRDNALMFNSATGTMDKAVSVTEGRDHFQAGNSIRLDRQIRDWLYVSGGYLFTDYDGEAAFAMSTVGPAGNLTPDDKYWFSNRLLLDQHSHVFNLNALLGPWQGLTLSAGVQNEWMWQHGIGNVRLDEGIPGDPFFVQTPVTLDSDIDRAAVQEDVGLRYTAVPYTVLFAEGRMQQESIGQYEDEIGGTRDFLRDTDATGELKEGRVGFNFSPVPVVSLQGHFKHRIKNNGYQHLTDASFGLPVGEGYSAFIRSRETETDEASLKLVLRPASWLRATLSYQIVATDYTTVTDSFIIPAFPPFPEDVITPGGAVFAGNYDAHVYGINLAVTPWRRVRLSSGLTLRDSRTSTAQNAIAAVTAYDGLVYSILSVLNYTFNEKTEASATYTYSWADYGQNNVTDGQPYGLVYNWHGASLGLTRKINKNVTISSQYRLYLYDEPSSSGAGNYTAHGVFASMTWVFD